MNMESSAEGGRRNQWFALRVKPRFEKPIARVVRNKGFEEFLPLYRCRRRWSDRVKDIDLPLFPGYVFCQLNPAHRLPLLTIPGALHFVGIGRIPAPIEEQEIGALRRAMESGLWAEPWPFLDVGQRVRLDDGPLTGVEGILIEVRKQHRIVVSVSLLQRSVAVVIERDWVRPVDGRISRPPLSLKAPGAVVASTLRKSASGDRVRV